MCISIKFASFCAMLALLISIVSVAAQELKINDLPRLNAMTKDVWNELTVRARQRGDGSDFPQLSIVSGPDRLIARFGSVGNVVQIGQDLVLATANLARANICVFVCPTIAGNPQRQQVALGRLIWSSEKKASCNNAPNFKYFENWPTEFGLNDTDIKALSNYRFPNGGYKFEELADNHFQFFIGFVLAHELGHYMLHHQADASNQESIFRSEEEADNYAFRLLQIIQGFHSEYTILPLTLKLAQLTFNRDVDADFARALGLRLTSALIRMFEETQPRNENALHSLRGYERMLLEMDFAIERRGICQ